MHQQNIMETQPHNGGFTLTELIYAMAVIVILAGITIISFYLLTRQAYNIMAKHDLEHFIQAENTYYAAHKAYLGDTGDFIEGYITAPFDHADFKFTPADGVRIDIISGNGSLRKSPPQIKASHRQGNIIYMYDFTTGKITERIKK
jgi:prepilin-type N-terminal cleavage/methylation domain-containing protein